MKARFVLPLVVACVFFPAVFSGEVRAQEATPIGVAVLDEGTFVTVRDTPNGDIISLYKVRGDRVTLVDTVFNSISRDIHPPKRYLRRVDIEEQ